MKIIINKHPKQSGKTSSKSKVPKKSPSQSFEELIEQKSQDMAIVVQFYANWCGPCKVLKPVLEKLAKEGNGKWGLALVDVEKYGAIAARHGVRGIPDVRMFYKGEVIAKFTGAKPEYIVKNWLDRNLPKRSRKTEYDDLSLKLKQGNLDAAKYSLLELLHKNNPESALVKLGLAIESIGENNSQAMQWINQIENRGPLGQLAKIVRDMVDMDVDEKDSGTPNYSPYNPHPTSINDKIDINNFNFSFLAQLTQDLINEVRIKKGLPALSEDSVLLAAANDHNEYQIKKSILTHHQNSRSKRTVKDRVDGFGSGFLTVGENVQYQGFPVRQWHNRTEVMTDTYFNTAEKLLKNWVNSPGHYKNIVTRKFKYTGVAIGWNSKNNAIYATQVFGG